LEESAWHFSPEALVGIYHWSHTQKGVTYLRFAFTGRVQKHESQRPLDNGIRQTLWLTLDEIRAQAHRHRSPQVQRCIDDYLAGQRFPLSLIKDMGVYDLTRDGEPE
jgi:hypothetical protein